MDDLFASQPIAGATLARSDIERLIGKVPRTLIDCDLEEADLSGLDLTRWRFERCNLRRSDLAGAMLEGTVWQGCRGPFANFSGANLSEAEFIGGDWNNCVMRRAGLTAGEGVKWECSMAGDEAGAYTVEQVDKPGRGTEIRLQLPQRARIDLTGKRSLTIVPFLADFQQRLLRAALSPEGTEGQTAFLQKRKANWMPQ